LPRVPGSVDPIGHRLSLQQPQRRALSGVGRRRKPTRKQRRRRCPSVECRRSRTPALVNIGRAIPSVTRSTGQWSRAIRPAASDYRDGAGGLVCSRITRNTLRRPQPTNAPAATFTNPKAVPPTTLSRLDVATPTTNPHSTDAPAPRMNERLSDRSSCTNAPTTRPTSSIVGVTQPPMHGMPPINGTRLEEFPRQHGWSAARRSRMPAIVIPRVTRPLQIGRSALARTIDGKAL
jgi:hypothetical protein